MTFLHLEAAVDSLNLLREARISLDGERMASLADSGGSRDGSWPLGALLAALGACLAALGAFAGAKITPDRSKGKENKRKNRKDDIARINFTNFVTQNE